MSEQIEITENTAVSSRRAFEQQPKGVSTRPPVHPFEQQPKESAKAFAAFSLYLSLGPERSLAAVAQKLAKSEQLLKRWSAKFDWPARVQAHAAHLAIVERQATEALARSKGAEWVARREQVRDEEWAMHQEALAAGREALKRFYDRGKGATLGDIARILELASKLGRLAAGMATDRHEVTGEDGGPIQIELTAALNKIYGEVVDVQIVKDEAAPSSLPKDAFGPPGGRALPEGNA